MKCLKYKYMRCLDNKLWDEMAEYFAEDATCSYSGGRYEFSGREAILNFFREGMDPAHILSSHTVHHSEIDLNSEKTASGVLRFSISKTSRVSPFRAPPGTATSTSSWTADGKSTTPATSGPGRKWSSARTTIGSPCCNDGATKPAQAPMYRSPVCRAAPFIVDRSQTTECSPRHGKSHTMTTRQ